MLSNRNIAYLDAVAFDCTRSSVDMGASTKVCKLLSLLCGIIVFICIVRTVILLNSSGRRWQSLRKTIDHVELTEERWLRFRESLRIKTITHELKEIRRFTKNLLEAHPAVFRSKLVEYEIVNGHSLLIHVQGRDRSLLPYLLCAHIDVVPVEQSEWLTDPFNATEDEGRTKVYGRGALDDKGNLMAHLAALEVLLEEGTVPNRSFYLAYGHDEEVFGPDGAPEVAKALKRKGVQKVHFVLDEGLIIMRNIVDRSDKDIAMIGVTEKGMMTLNLSVSVRGGHSSAPRTETAMSILSSAVHRLQSYPMAGKIDQLVHELSESLAPELGFPGNVLASNLWLFQSIWWQILARFPTLQGMVRTTTAVTVFRAGERFNVISPTAWAVVNHRIHPMDSFQQVLDYDRQIINDHRVKITIMNTSHVHPISPFDRASSLPYQVLAETIEQSFENTIVAPATLFANTDTRCYLHLTENIYRFSPMVLTVEDVAGIHSRNEALSKTNFKSMINFFYRLMKNADRTELRDTNPSKVEL